MTHRPNAITHTREYRSRVVRYTFIMRPSSLGGGRILRRTLSVCLSVCPSVCPSVPLSSVTSLHLANYNDTHVLFGRRRGPHIVRPSRPHKLVIFGLFTKPNIVPLTQNSGDANAADKPCDSVMQHANGVADP